MSDIELQQDRAADAMPDAPGPFGAPIRNLLARMEVTVEQGLAGVKMINHWYILTIQVTQDNSYETALVKTWLDGLPNIASSSICGRIYKADGHYMLAYVGLDEIRLSMIRPGIGYFPNPVIFRDVNGVDQLGFSLQIVDPSRASSAAELMRESLYQARRGKHPKRKQYIYPRQEWKALMELVNPAKAKNVQDKEDIPFIKCPLFGYDMPAFCSTLSVDQIIIQTQQGFLVAAGFMPQKKAVRYESPVYQIVLNLEAYYALLPLLNHLYKADKGLCLNDFLLGLSNLQCQETTAFTYESLDCEVDKEFWRAYLSHINRMLVM